MVPSSSVDLMGANRISATSSRTDELVFCRMCTFFSSVGLDEALAGAVIALANAEDGDVDDEGIDACACAALLLFLLV